MPSEGLDRALCVVSPHPTLPYPAPGPGGREPEGAGLRCPAARERSALLRAALRQAAFRPQAWWHPESALALIFKKATSAANLVKKYRGNLVA